ncbi:hypothetical protein [Acetivibrio ethanolgignens]|uniref:Uncharacterized protein n=1 Tax=Acetivibrio ethanolgignens TaxID=290052 RepID=A0A0V8QBE9_9FIRM|nr:hypothetical protein [Acetivibrio ethanolgignens]KSV57903.1 hypothetical protein ASU35_14925 [Acetivibrio ethanolgignens]
MSDYIFDREITKLTVLCGQCALVRNGLTTQDGIVLTMWTPFKEIDGINYGAMIYYYNPDIDTEFCVKPMHTNPLLLLPSPERAIVEYVKNEKWCDEGTLIEAIKTYMLRFNDKEELFRVADYFSVPRETIEYWIHEAETDEEV